MRYTRGTGPRPARQATSRAPPTPTACPSNAAPAPSSTPAESTARTPEVTTPSAMPLPARLSRQAAPPTHIPLGGRVHHEEFRLAWDDLLGFAGGDCSWHREVLRAGLRLSWAGPRSASGDPVIPEHLHRPRDSRRWLGEDTLDLAEGEIVKLRAAGVIQPTTLPPTVLPQGPGTVRPRAWSTVFFIDKPGSGPPPPTEPAAAPGTPPRRKVRPIANLARVNEYLAKPGLRMSGIAQLRELIPRDAWMVSIDIKSAFFHLGLDEWSRETLTPFQWGTEAFTWSGLPMGARESPAAFTRLLRPVWAALHKAHPSVGTNAYIDDVLAWSADRSALERAARDLVNMLHNLGVEVSMEKSELTPTRRINYLGFTLDSHRMRLSVPTDKRRKLRKEVRATLRKIESGTSFTIRAVAALQGRLGALRPAVALTHRFTAALQGVKNAALRSAGQCSPPLSPTETYDSTVSWSPAAVAELEWWSATLSSPTACRSPFTPPPPDLIIESDASGTGWGFTLRKAPAGHRTPQTAWTRAELDQLPLLSEAGGRWPTHFASGISSINVSEAYALELALRTFSESIRGRSILLLTDNAASNAYINRQRGRHEHLTGIAARIWDLVTALRLTALRSAWIAGAENGGADHLSREGADPAGWGLHPAEIRRAWAAFGSPTVDCFATSTNAILPTFFSRRPDPLAAHTDAMSLPWTGRGLLWIFPPFAMVGGVLAKIRREQVAAIAVLPDWPARPWWPLATEMAVASYTIPAGSPALVPGTARGEGPIRPVPTRWQLRVVLLQGHPDRRRRERTAWGEGTHPAQAPGRTLPEIFRSPVAALLPTPLWSGPAAPPRGPTPAFA